MLPLLERTVNPGYSKIYRRFLVLIGLLTVLFVLNSSVYFTIKLTLIAIALFQLKSQYGYGKPHPELSEIKRKGDEWLLISATGHEKIYERLIILIHNPLFQLLRFSQSNKNKILILFNDQLSSDQLRLLYLNSVKN